MPYLKILFICLIESWKFDGHYGVGSLSCDLSCESYSVIFLFFLFLLIGLALQYFFGNLFILNLGLGSLLFCVIFCFIYKYLERMRT